MHIADLTRIHVLVSSLSLFPCSSFSLW